MTVEGRYSTLLRQGACRQPLPPGGSLAEEGSRQPVDTSPLLQTGFCVGASVYDNTHKRSRGYGTIQRAGKPAACGVQRWVVAFGGWQRRLRAIAETYLDLPLVPHSCQVRPSGIQEKVLVVLGPHKGKTAVVVEKVNRGWTCQLTGEQRLRYFRPEYLHVCAPAVPFAPLELECPLSDMQIGEQADSWVWSFEFD